eukprot:scaffold166212_cov28-Tisochrysis_lutea.AAC.1
MPQNGAMKGPPTEMSRSSSTKGYTPSSASPILNLGITMDMAMAKPVVIVSRMGIQSLTLRIIRMIITTSTPISKLLVNHSSIRRAKSTIATAKIVR